MISNWHQIEVTGLSASFLNLTFLPLKDWEDLRTTVFAEPPRSKSYRFLDLNPDLFRQRYLVNNPCRTIEFVATGNSIKLDTSTAQGPALITVTLFPPNVLSVLFTSTILVSDPSDHFNKKANSMYMSAPLKLKDMLNFRKQAPSLIKQIIDSKPFNEPLQIIGDKVLKFDTAAGDIELEASYFHIFNYRIPDDNYSDTASIEINKLITGLINDKARFDSVQADSLHSDLDNFSVEGATDIYHGNNTVVSFINHTDSGTHSDQPSITTKGTPWNIIRSMEFSYLLKHLVEQSESKVAELDYQLRSLISQQEDSSGIQRLNSLLHAVIAERSNLISQVNSRIMDDVFCDHPAEILLRNFAISTDLIKRKLLVDDRLKFLGGLITEYSSLLANRHLLKQQENLSIIQSQSLRSQMQLEKLNVESSRNTQAITIVGVIMIFSALSSIYAFVYDLNANNYSEFADKFVDSGLLLTTFLMFIVALVSIGLGRYFLPRRAQRMVDEMWLECVCGAKTVSEFSQRIADLEVMMTNDLLENNSDTQTIEQVFDIITRSTSRNSNEVLQKMLDMFSDKTRDEILQLQKDLREFRTKTESVTKLLGRLNIRPD